MPATNVVKPEGANAGSPKNSTTAQTVTPEFVNSAMTELAYRLSGKQPAVLAASDAASAAPAPASTASTASAAAAVTQSSPRTYETNLSTAPTRPVGGLDNYQRPSLVKNGVYATVTPYNVNEGTARVNSMKIERPKLGIAKTNPGVGSLYIPEKPATQVVSNNNGGWLTKFN